MREEMEFPDTLDEFIKQYSFIDEEQIYTNGSELIQTFRIKQWEEHKKQEIQSLKKQLEENKLNHKQLKDLDKIEKSFIEIKNQQKEFVKYLEDKLRIANEVLDNPEEDEEVRGYILARKFMLEEILSKCYEIIGG